MAYFGHVARFEDPIELRNALCQKDPTEVEGERAVDQAHVISGLALLKYRLIQISIGLAGTSAVLGLGAVVINSINGS